MLTGRDRLLAALFALQLLAVLVFGLVLVKGVGGARQATTAAQLLAGPVVAGAPVATAVPRPSARPVVAGAAVPGTAGSSTTTTQAGGATNPVAGSTGSAVVAKGAPIKIGSIVSQTGAINFAASAQGTKAYLDMVNAQGGVNGHQIQLDLRDDQLDGVRGRQQAQQMVAEGVFAFAAWNAPQTESGIVPFLEQNKVPLIGNYGVGREYHSAYSYPLQSHHYGFEMGRFLAQEKRVTHPGVIFIGGNDTAANTAQRQAFTAGVKAGGKTLAAGDILQVDVTQVSYDNIVTQLRLAGVDGLATLIDQTAYNRLQQSLDRQNYRPVHVADPLFTDPTVLQGPTTEGTLVASDFTPVDYGAADVRAYATEVRKRFGAQAQVSYLGQAGWLDARILVEALRRMGDDLTRVNLMRVMDSLPASVAGGFTAPLYFGPGDHDINRCLLLSRVSGGALVRYRGFACDNEVFG